MELVWRQWCAKRQLVCVYECSWFVCVLQVTVAQGMSGFGWEGFAVTGVTANVPTMPLLLRGHETMGLSLAFLEL